MTNATQGKGAARAQKIKGALEFVGLRDREPPELAIDVIDPSGKRTPIELARSGEFQLDEELVGKGYSLEIRAAAGGSPRRFTYDTFFEQVRKEAVYRLPEATWTGWLFWQICVTGRVRVCRPVFNRVWPVPEWQARLEGEARLIDLSESLIDPSIIWPGLVLNCNPVCHGKVEVFLRTCCCPPIGPIDPPVIIKDICQIIDCDIFEPRPKPWPWPEPWPPGPWPGPGPGPDPELERSTLRALKRADAVEGAPNAARVLRLSQHLSVLRRLPLAEQIRYIDAHADLRYWRCTCSTVKVAEVPLQADGHFDACFFDSPFVPAGCTRRVLYRVSQVRAGGWVVIYDGPARGESFALNENAELSADPNAEACEDPREWPEGTPFVILEQIGNTWADTLIHSTQQMGETEFGGPLAAKDGLANEAPAGPVPVTSGPYDQPWGLTLNLRYQFHPGLVALGAKYYRTRVIRVNANGQPMAGGANFVLTGPLSWRKYYPPPGGGVGVQWVPLNNPVINSFEGLYTIPYPDLVWPWLGGQWHAFVVTNELIAGVPRMPNGRYLFVVDIFNAAGQRLRPTNSIEPAAPGEVTVAFEYRRLDGPIDAAFSNTSVVEHKALANLFRVDNLSCYADIEQIIDNGKPSDANCQFLVGPGSDTLQLQYSAYQSNGFQWHHCIRYKQGLTGPTTELPASNANVFSGSSPALTFAALLGPETKCAFAANLYVYARHTNGIGRIDAYDREDVAAFALEIGP